MGDAGEGLVDAEARIAERLEEVARARTERRDHAVIDLEAAQALESMRLARIELDRQLASTSHERRRSTIVHAIAELDRRMAEAGAHPRATSAPSARREET